jgi:preprotein translocase subunit SecF
MIKLIKQTNINFIGVRKYAYILSGTLIGISIFSLLLHGGPKWSIDFLGGTVVQLKFEKPIAQDMAKIRDIITHLNFGSPEIKTVGSESDNEIQITVLKKEEGTTVGDEIKSALEKSLPDNKFDLRREEKVGPKIGSELRTKGLLAVFLAALSIIAYIGLRFSLPYGVGGVLAILHDLIIVTGIFSLLGLEISIPIIAALLTIAGYSINDTIVVFDRIRENSKNLTLKKSLEDLINISVNQTLSRTIITSLLTFLSILPMFIAFMPTEDVIKYFCGAMIAGIVVGTYSSIYVASPILIEWNKRWPITKY